VTGTAVRSHDHREPDLASEPWDIDRRLCERARVRGVSFGGWRVSPRKLDDREDVDNDDPNHGDRQQSTAQTAAAWLARRQPTAERLQRSRPGPEIAQQQ
jgi:hypothetical protein